MRIISLNVVAFGKLKDVQINFQNGLNVLQNVNGFGKTTVASFIRAMLYGFTYRHSGGATDASHFQPWGSSERFGGSMTVAHDGEIYRIERFFGATARAEKCRVTNEKTGKEMAWQVPGETLLGLTAESYDRSAYFPQEAVELSSNDNFEKRLANLVENGAEDFEKVQNRLRDYKKNLRYERGVGGRIADLQKQQSDLEHSLQEIKEAKRRKTQIESSLQQLASKQAELQRMQRENRSESERLQRRLAQAVPSEEEISARARLQQVEENLGRIPAQFEADLSRCDNLYREISAVPPFRTEQTIRKRWWLAGLAAAFAVIGVLMIVLGVVGVVPVAVGATVGTAAIVLSVVSCFFVVSKQTRQVSLEKERSGLLDEYFSIASRYVYVEDANPESVRRALWDLNSRYQGDLQLRETLKKIIRPQVDLSQLRQSVDACAAAEQQLSQMGNNLLSEEVSLREEAKRLNVDTVQIEDKLLDVKAQLAQAEYRYKVAELTLKLLEKAKDSLSGSYLPRLCHRTTELLQEISSMSLEAAVDNKFVVNLRERGVTKPMSEFSRGIREITLLCFRIALSELLYDGAIPFLIVDDAFVNYDEYNFVRATELLKKLSAHTQIIYFTCHNRTGKLLNK